MEEPIGKLTCSNSERRAAKYCVSMSGVSRLGCNRTDTQC